MLSLSNRLEVNLGNYMGSAAARNAAEEVSAWVAPRGFKSFEILAQFAERMASNAQQAAERNEAVVACRFINVWAKRLGVDGVKASEFRSLNKRAMLEAKMDLRRRASQLALVVSRSLRGSISNSQERLSVAKMAAVVLNNILYKGVVIDDVHLHLVNKYPAASAADVLAAAKVVMVTLEARHKNL